MNLHLRGGPAQPRAHSWNTVLVKSPPSRLDGADQEPPEELGAQLLHVRARLPCHLGGNSAFALLFGG